MGVNNELYDFLHLNYDIFCMVKKILEFNDYYQIKKDKIHIYYPNRIYQDMCCDDIIYEIKQIFDYKIVDKIYIYCKYDMCYRDRYHCLYKIIEDEIIPDDVIEHITKNFNYNKIQLNY